MKNSVAVHLYQFRLYRGILVRECTSHFPLSNQQNTCLGMNWIFFYFVVTFTVQMNKRSNFRKNTVMLRRWGLLQDKLVLSTGLIM